MIYSVQIVRTYISIHAPREGGDLLLVGDYRNQCISIHAPREGGDRRRYNHAENEVISIHAPREGGDFISAMR